MRCSAARAGAAYGVPIAIRCGADAPAELQLALDEEITARRVLTFRPSPRLIAAVNGEEIEEEPVMGRALSTSSI